MKFRVKYIPNKLDINNPNVKEETIVVEASGKLEAAMVALNHYPNATVMRVLTPGDTE